MLVINLMAPVTYKILLCAYQISVARNRQTETEPSMNSDILTRLFVPLVCGLSAILFTIVSYQQAWAETDVSKTDLIAKEKSLEKEYSKNLLELANWCVEKKLDRCATITRSWIIKKTSDQQYYIYIPSGNSIELQRKKFAAKDKTNDEKQWLQQFRKLRNDRADVLFQLAEDFATSTKTNGKSTRNISNRVDLSKSIALLYATLRENPDHPKARKMFGHQQHEGRWYTSWELQKIKSGKVWHRQFGWIATADVKRYENGERRKGSRWINKEQDAKAHSTIKKGWKIETNHFLVTTSHSLEQGVKLANRLERFYQVWRQAFAEYYLTPAIAQKAFKLGKLPTQKKKFKVVYFRDKQQYINALRTQPNIAISIGVYLDKFNTAYFYAGKDQDPGTIFHEATHQLIKESWRSTKYPGKTRHFWIVEGIACYMETYQDHGNFATLGGKKQGRMPAAIHRFLVDQFYIPFGELTQMGSGDMQRHRRIATIYSQTAGQVDFLLNTGQGQYRSGLMQYLQDVYSGKAKRQSLELKIGQSHEKLDKMYADYLRQLVK